MVKGCAILFIYVLPTVIHLITSQVFHNVNNVTTANVPPCRCRVPSQHATSVEKLHIR